MNRVDLTKSTFEEDIPKPEVTKNKPVLFNVILVISLVILICLFVFLFKRYRDRDAMDLFESKINMTINLAREAVSDEKYEDDYLLVKFPDKNDVITKDGIMSFNGKELDEFPNGYIIVYKDDSIAFKLSDGTYCASKSYDDESYNLFIFGNCLNYDIKYKED